ncbi:MAG: GtrA family protein [Lachnospiraceae bacterium]|nr:GtrA family protein [Lachnospiraceae bacterium]
MDDLIIKILGFFHIKLSEGRETALIQFIKFGIVGVSNTFLSYAINVAVLLMLSPFRISWDYFVANIIAFILSVAWSFFWNNKYVFRSREGEKRNIWAALLKTYISYAVTGLVLANILSYLWVDVIGISKYIAPLLNLVISVPVNFLLNKLWAFKA